MSKELAVRRFAGGIERTASLVYDYAGTYSLRLKLDDEGSNRFEPLADRLTFKHWLVVYKEVLNRAEDNALECGAWLEKAADNGWSAAELRRRIRRRGPAYPYRKEHTASSTRIHRGSTATSVPTSRATGRPRDITRR